MDLLSLLLYVPNFYMLSSLLLCGFNMLFPVCFFIVNFDWWFGAAVGDIWSCLVIYLIFASNFHPTEVIWQNFCSTIRCGWSCHWQQCEKVHGFYHERLLEWPGAKISWVSSKSPPWVNKNHVPAVRGRPRRYTSWRKRPQGPVDVVVMVWLWTDK